MRTQIHLGLLSTFTPCVLRCPEILDTHRSRGCVGAGACDGGGGKGGGGRVREGGGSRGCQYTACQSRYLHGAGRVVRAKPQARGWGGGLHFL